MVLIAIHIVIHIRIPHEPNPKMLFEGNSKCDLNCESGHFGFITPILTQRKTNLYINLKSHCFQYCSSWRTVDYDTLKWFQNYDIKLCMTFFIRKRKQLYDKIQFLRRKIYKVENKDQINVSFSNPNEIETNYHLNEISS